MTWVEIALHAGGALHVRMENGMLIARMSWPGERDVAGAPKQRVDAALNSLSEALCEDAAEEMCLKGGV